MLLTSKIISFFETPVNTRQLAYFRIALGAFCILKILILFPALNDYYGQYGIIQWAISKAAIGPYLPHLGDLSNFLIESFSISATTAFYTIFISYIFCLLSLTFGFLTRIMAIICWLFHLAWMNTGGAFVYGVDVFTQISLFYLLFMPSGKYLSLDILLKISKPQKTSLAGGMTKRVFQLQMCIMYFSSGVEKVSSVQWRSGEAIWRAVMMPSFKQFDLTWLSNYTFIPFTLGWLTVLIEISYCVLVWIPKFRVLAIFSVIMLHISIGLFMGMWFFSVVMILISLFCYGEECYEDIKKTLSKYNSPFLIKIKQIHKKRLLGKALNS
jgi:hypothetical protein